MMAMIGGWELLLVLFAVLILFGGRRLPELARNLGKGLREFKRATQGLPDEEPLEESVEDKTQSKNEDS